MREVDCSERWRSVEGLEGVYSISDRGRLRRDVTSSNSKAGFVLKPFPRKSGYCCYTVWHLGKMRTPLVHRMVAQAFIPNPDGKPHINHRDGNKSNNSLENLEWCTAKENVKHAMEVLGWNPKMGDHPKGEKHYKARLTQDQVDSIRARYLAGTATQYAMAKEYGVSRKTVHSLIKGHSWGAAEWRRRNFISEPTKCSTSSNGSLHGSNLAVG